jgi:signal peptidase I
LSLFVLGEEMARLTFGKTKKRVNYDLLQIILKWAFEIALVCFIAFVFVWFFGLRVSVIGDSMNPRLSNGNVVLVNRVAYNMGAPKRGDVIAFKPNGNESAQYYVKRIIGLPGETVEVKDGYIWVNGKKLKDKYQTSKIEEAGLLQEPITLGTKEYFVLGDDRSNSEDSRHADVGNVERSAIKGKVWFTIVGKKFGFVR